ncbi:hypothetical protein D3C87_2076850 [compost metagenome]
MAGDAFEDLVFSNALARRFVIGDGIARAAVKQAMIASGGASGNIVAFQQRNA